MHRRLTAWLLMFVCAWMGTGGVLHHSELDSPQPKPHAAPHLSRQSAPPAVDACAACQWTQGLTAKTSLVIRLPSPLFLLHPYAPSVPTCPVLTALCFRPSRAPPAVA